MPVRTTITANPALSASFGVNSAVAEGRRWTVAPLLPSPDAIVPADASPEEAARAAVAQAFITANKNKVENVSVWRGIQYGQEPVGALRFKPCAPFVHPAGTFDATTQAPPPYQRYLEELGKDGRPEFGASDVGVYDWVGQGTRESEDCLRLNIYGPEGLTLRPVVFHIHGGGWGVYHADGFQQLGHRMAANRGCVVVTPEYRLSTLGHFPHPDLIADGEPSVAYTDIKTALKWTFDNVASFGGDPTKICITGTSAGGAAVQMLLEDDEAQAWFSSALVGSGGGTGIYPDAAQYTKRAKQFERAVRITGAALISAHHSHVTVKEAIDAQGFAWAAQNAMTVAQIQSLADARTVVSGIPDAVAGTTPAVFASVPTDNVYPFRRSTYPNAIEAAKAGKYRKPFISLYAECEALNLMGSDYFTIRDTLLALPVATLDGWSQRLGYVDYDGWKSGAWHPVGGLEALSSAQYKTANDPLAVDCENRRVLYTHAVFSYPAWRVARAATETVSASAWLMCNNFSANSVWAGHSQEVALFLGNIEWLVAGGGEYPAAEVPGEYVNNRMDAFYVSEFMMDMVARLAATGDPNGAYTFAGFDLFSDPATAPPDGGQLSATPVAYSVALSGHQNVIGKYFGPLDNLNAGTFSSGSIIPALNSCRDATLQHVEYMGDAMLEYLSLLEPGI